jgi:hypothetical protein
MIDDLDGDLVGGTGADDAGGRVIDVHPL